MTPEEIAALEQQYNELKSIYDSMPDDPSPSVPNPAMKAFGEGLLPGVAAGITGPFKLAYEVGKTYAEPDALRTGNPIADIGTAAIKTIYKGAEPGVTGALKHTARIGASVIPGGGTAFDVAGDAISGDLKATEQYAGQLGEEIGSFIGGAGFGGVVGAAARPAGRIAKGTGQAVRDFALGPPESQLLRGEAYRPDIIANKLDYGRSPTGDYAKIQSAKRYNEDFVRIDPSKGIDTTQPGHVQMEQLKQNLQTAYDNAVANRKGILEEAVTAQVSEAAKGNPAAAPITFESLPKSTTDGFGVDKLKLLYGDESVSLADDFVAREFGKEVRMLKDDGTPVYGPGRNLTLAEADFLRRKIDTAIEQAGGFDQSYWAGKLKDPSLKDGYVEGLKFYRSQIDGLIKSKMEGLLGSEKAAAYDLAGRDIATKIEYTPMIDRFTAATGEAFTPGSAKKAPPGQGQFLGGARSAISGVMEEMAPGRQQNIVRERYLSREAALVKQLQEITSIRENQLKPIPRKWDLIKSSSLDLEKAGTLAVMFGLINDPSELYKMPDSAAKKIMSVLAVQAPDAFEPNPDKVATFDGQFILPQERDDYTRDAIDKDAATRFKAIGEGTLQNKYVPMNKIKPVAQPTLQPALPDINSMNSMLGNLGAASLGVRQPPPPDHLLLEQQLEEATVRHSGDRIQ